MATIFKLVQSMQIRDRLIIRSIITRDLIDKIYLSYLFKRHSANVFYYPYFTLVYICILFKYVGR